MNIEMGCSPIRKLSCSYPFLLEPSVQEYFANLKAHERLLADKIRLSAFRKAIHEVVKLGDVVMDIGAGTGIMSEYAIEAGASLVYVVEENSNILDIARKRLSHYDGVGLEFYSLRSTNLPSDAIAKPADVIISETLGCFGFNEGIIQTLRDARRFITQEGAFIPAGFRLMTSPCRISYHNIQPNLNCILVTDFAQYAINVPLNGKPIMEYSATHDKLLYQCASFTLPARDLLNPGAAIWFEANLSPRTKLSNSPFDPITSWGHVLLFIDSLPLIDTSESNKSILLNRFRGISIDCLGGTREQHFEQLLAQDIISTIRWHIITSTVESGISFAIAVLMEDL